METVVRNLSLDGYTFDAFDAAVAFDVAVLLYRVRITAEFSQKHI